MSCKIIIDHDKVTTTNREIPIFPWVRHDAGKFLFEEALLNGNYVGMYYSGTGRGQTRDMMYDKYNSADKGINARYMRDHLMAFSLEIDGQLLKDGWQWEGDKVESTPDGGCRESVITLSNGMVPVEVKIHTRLDGTSFAERWLEITNRGNEKAGISGLAPWCGIVFSDIVTSGINRKEEMEFSLGHFKNSNWCMEGEFVWDKLHEGTWKIGNGKMIKFGPSFYILRNHDSGEMMVIDFEQTGGIDIEFTNANNNYFRLGNPWRGGYLHAKAGMGGSAPIRVLEPGETVSSPHVHFAMLYGDMDIGVNELYRHLRRSVIPGQPAGIEHPLAYNYGGNNACCQTNVGYVRSEIESAAALGAELFMVDAGWFGAKDKGYSEVFGDWVDTPGLADGGGLKGCFDYARQKGMKCGLWVAIEILGPSSEFAAAHKDWFMNDNGREVPLLDITKPEVEQHMYDKVCELVDRYELDCFRMDGGYEHLSPLNRKNGRYVEDTMWLYCEKLHGIFERVRAKYPRLYLENCWGGGGRTDLGMMRRYHWVQLSDNQHPEEQLRILNGMTLAMPPEQCMLFIAECHTNQADADYLARIGLFSQSCMVGVFPTLAKANEGVLESFRRMADLYKNEMRPMIMTCKVYHHTPIQVYTESGEWVVLEYASQNADHAVAGFFRLGGGDDDIFRFRAKGLSPAKNYRVWYDNDREAAVVSGRELCKEGICVRVPGNLRSELLIIKEIK